MSSETLDLDEIERRIAAADKEVGALCSGPNRIGGRRWTMTVPVDPTDSDIVFVDALDAARQMLASLRRKPGQPPAPEAPFKPDYDWTSTCPHEGEDRCPDECRCECHAISPESVR